jgi:hypothetical protein
MRCETQDEIRRQLEAVLWRIDRLTQQQIQATHEYDDPKFSDFDKQLELSFGEKERLFGALRQHRQDHGC